MIQPLAPARRPGAVAACVAVAVGSIALGGSAGELKGQGPEELTVLCTQAGGLPAVCSAAAVAGRSLLGDVGLLSGLGSKVAGTATTLGTRVGGGPRLSFSARISSLNMGLPDFSDPAGGAEADLFASAFHFGAAAGLFDGFRLMPTVGGFLSVDAFGQASFLLLPEGEGFTGGARSYSAGVRVGILREGFTVPGISVSAARRFPDDVGYGLEGDPASTTLQPGVTALRATIGKDLFAVEWVAGIGWEDYDSQTTLRAADGAGGFVTISGDLEDSRLLYFGSAAMTFGIVLSMSLEAGWAEGLGPVPTYVGQHDPAAGALFGSLSARLTL